MNKGLRSNKFEKIKLQTGVEYTYTLYILTNITHIDEKTIKSNNKFNRRAIFYLMCFTKDASSILLFNRKKSGSER